MLRTGGVRRTDNRKVRRVFTSNSILIGCESQLRYQYSP